MKNKSLLTIVIALVLVVIFALLLFTFQVRQSEVVVKSRFLRPVDTITNAGLYIKLPWPIESINRFDQRVQTFADKFSQNLTHDSTMLQMSVYVGWRISDAKVFFPKFPGGDTVAAQAQLEEMLRSTKAAVIGKHNLSDFVNSDPSQLKFNDIEQEIQTGVSALLATNNYGMSIEFLGIKKLGLPADVTQAVFERMKAERTKLINEAQFNGEADAAKIKSAADRRAADTLANASAVATRIEGEGVAEAAKTLNVFQQKPELAILLLRLEAIKSSANKNTTIILDERTAPFDLFRSLPAGSGANTEK